MIEDVTSFITVAVPVLVPAFTALIVPAITYVVKSRINGTSCPSILVTQESLVDDAVALLSLKFEVCLVSKSPSMLFRQKGKAYVSVTRSKRRSYDYVIASRSQLDAIRALVSN